MNNKNLMKKKEEEIGSENLKAGLEKGDCFRVVISREANMFLEQKVEQVCEGFANIITKSDVANYIFSNLNRLLAESDIKTLRALHFDDKKVLGTLLRADDDLPEDLKRAIRAHYGLTDREKKRINRAPSDLSTEASVDNPSTEFPAA